MRIHECSRCEGCGYITGMFRWEIAWSRWASDPTDPKANDGLLEAQPCPDCGGTGALIELEEKPQLDLPTRRGIPRDPYADHVAAVLRSQRPTTN